MAAEAEFRSELFIRLCCFHSLDTIGEFARPHFPKPFFKKARRFWNVEINRKQINLGPDKDGAFRQYHQLMGQSREQTVSPESLVAIIDPGLFTRRIGIGAAVAAVGHGN